MAQETEIRRYEHPSRNKVADNYDDEGYKKTSDLFRDFVPQKHYPIHYTFLIFQA